MHHDKRITTNREIERRETENVSVTKVSCKKTAQKRIKGSGKNQEKQEIAIFVPSVNALTGFASKGNAAGEYRVVKSRTIMLQDEYVHSVVSKDDSETLRQDSVRSDFVHLRDHDEVTRTTT